MDYPYENLTPEKFQHFCQALLAHEYPGIQCLPVGQPDGGRDAIQTFGLQRKGEKFAVFQVKFVRNPKVVSDPHKWLLEVMEEELPKVKRQIRAGAKFYSLMTNVPGTAHPDTGSIDQVNKLLGESLEIATSCLWRNDLNRRLDSAWDLKWAYPELLTGPDLIRVLLENQLSEARERRTNAISSFLACQYNQDEFVKFKQVDLENRLLDLFIDVPILHRESSRMQYPASSARLYVERRQEELRLAREISYDDYESYVDPRMGQFYGGYPKSTGAASFLLCTKAVEPSIDKQFVVIEGAPGQGKSTIVQYVCQVHRMILLGKKGEIEKIPEVQRSQAIRLPIKVDLRDFAAWLGRKNPFATEIEEISVAAPERSLEGFLAALIYHQSGGAKFDVSDLQAVSKHSPILLALDGLDEVADIKRREEVVGEIAKGAERLRAMAASLQIVVTSRPAAFENSPGLSEDTFSYYRLDAVTPELIEEYSSKWLKARKLSDRESWEIKKTLHNKLKLPHLRDLSRNPMQLAILLSLVHTRGSSLPEKRTALYDNYIELFFNRESEKSEIVRDNRDLLIDIHRYLAWRLHVESELGEGVAANCPAGAIEENRLRSELREYLINEGGNPELAGQLFTGMIERVVALVSRVQGTFEFEVQPLREYFAARFLHETAPYSPPGSEKRGTRPDRFDAIARNFYWLNVTRFYAGCYSKGELASLIDRLDELIVDPEFRFLSHSRVLGATLLGDWVFTQHPKSVKIVISKILDGLGLRFLLTATSRRQFHTQPLVLPIGCGRNELVEKCFSMLRAVPPDDYALDLIDLLKANADQNELDCRWEEILKIMQEKDSRTAWLNFGLRLGCFRANDSARIEAIMGSGPPSKDQVAILLKARCVDYIGKSDDRSLAVINAVLDRDIRVSFNPRNPSLIEAFVQAVDSTRYSLAFHDFSRAPLSEVLKRNLPNGLAAVGHLPTKNPSWELASACLEVVSEANKALGIESGKWASSLEPWNLLVSSLCKNFGERWVARQLANIAAGIVDRSSPPLHAGASELFDPERPLCERARYARLRAGHASWWPRQLSAASSQYDKMFCCLLYFTWAGPSNMAQNLEAFSESVLSLSDKEWELLAQLVEEGIECTRRSRDRLSFTPENRQIIAAPARVLALLRLRSRQSEWSFLYKEWVARKANIDKPMLKIFMSVAVAQLLEEPGDVEQNLGVLSAAYKSGILSPPFAPHLYSRGNHLRKLPVGLAERIVAEAEHYPSFLVFAAEASCKLATSRRVRPIGKVAEEDGWFK